MSEERIETLKGIIRDLHAGRDMAELKRRFSALTAGVSATEIAEMERQLIAEGMPEAEIKRLCDVHTEVFRDALDAATPRALPSDHPVEALRREGEELTRATAGLRRAAEALGSPPAAGRLPAARAELEAGITRLATVEGHWRRKEYQLFPILEKHGIVAPPKVMWAIHDDVRTLLKASREHLASGDATALAADIATLTRTVDDMVYKEEKILYPMCLDTFTAADWDTVRLGETERAGAETARTTLAGAGDALALDTGRLTPEQVRLMLKRVPFDVTFVDENDEVRFYSEGDRVFPRAAAVIGRKVQNCHPPKSVHIVQGILDSFRRGEKDVAEFWIEVGGRFIHIRYFALHDAAGAYKGTLEVVQDATAVRKLEGQRRLLDW